MAIYLFLLARICSFLSARIRAFSSSRSLRLACFSRTTKYVHIAPMMIALPAAGQTIQASSVVFMGSSLLSWVSLFVGCLVLALTLFWLVIVPIHDWFVSWLLRRFP